MIKKSKFLFCITVWVSEGVLLFVNLTHWRQFSIYCHRKAKKKAQTGSGWLQRPHCRTELSPLAKLVVPWKELSLCWWSLVSHYWTNCMCSLNLSSSSKVCKAGCVLLQLQDWYTGLLTHFRWFYGASEPCLGKFMKTKFSL